MPQPDHDLISDPSECSAGSAKTDSECQQCEANTYSRDGAYSCTKCTDGKTSDAGSTSETDCKDGEKPLY